MKTSVLQLNLLLAWIWIILGFGSGLLLGLKFHQENWLGGYASHRRRLYRLGHVSFFGLAMINLFFYFTARQFSADGPAIQWASWMFIAGAMTMPLCCLIMAHDTRWRSLFAIPVLTLLTGGLLTVWEVILL